MITPEISHTVYFETPEEKKLFQAALHHIKYKTGDPFNVILRKALNEYTMNVGCGNIQ